MNIAILIPLCSRNQSYTSLEDTPLIKCFLPGFLATKEAKYNYRIYVGYDDDDDFYKRQRDSLCPLVYSVTELTGCQHAPARAWNQLFALAAKENNDYFFQIGDDVTLTTKGWTTAFIERLRLNKDLGVVGPCDVVNFMQRTRSGCAPIIENSFVSKKHHEIFGDNFFHPEIANWYCDNWITEVYKPYLSEIMTAYGCQNLVRDQRYQIKQCLQLAVWIAEGRNAIERSIS